MPTHTLSRLPAQLGWSGGLGLALLGAAAILAYTLILPVRQDAAALRGEIQKLNADLQHAPASPPANSARQQLDAFIAALPSQNAINNALNELHSLATQHQLALKDSAYRPVPNASAAMRQLRISLKCEGSYTDLRHFLRAATLHLPALAVEQLSFSRQKISDTRLEAVVEFSLFYSAADAAHP